MTVHVDITLDNEVGLHARPAGMFVTRAATFDSDITITHDDRTADGKSLLHVLQLEAGHGAQLRITADGPDEDEAVRELAVLLREVE